MTLGEAMRRNGVEGVPPPRAALREAPPLLRRLWAGRVRAMATPHAVWVGPEALADITEGRGEALLRHELAHLEQWRVEGRLRFLTRYLGDYLLARAGGFPHRVAYRAVRFERAAAAAEQAS